MPDIVVTISTGGDSWAVMFFKDKGKAIEEAANKYAYARVKYEGEHTSIKGLSEKDISLVKEKAQAIIKNWSKTDMSDITSRPINPSKSTEEAA